MDDRELVQRLRDANPVKPPRNAPLTVRQRALMESIIAERPTPAPARRATAKWSLVAVPLGALAVLAVIFAQIGPFASAPAVAYGPPPLAYEAVNDSLEEIVHVAQQRLAAEEQPMVAERRSESVSWNLVVDESGEPAEVTFISPLVTSVTWTEDVAGTRVVREGEPFPVDDGAGLPSDIETVPGALVDEQTFGPGEYPAFLPDAGSLDGQYARDLLAQYAPTSTTEPGDAMWAISDLLNEWTLTSTQHSYLLDALLSYDRIKVMGTTTDRLGRAVIGIQGMSNGGLATTLFVSSETGRIVGVETTVATDDAALPVPQGTVTSYTLWKDHTVDRT